MEPKGRLRGQRIKAGDKVIVVDDVATSGKALLEAKDALDKIGVKIESALAIVDRKEGAAENLAKAGLKLGSIFSVEEILE